MHRKKKLKALHGIDLSDVFEDLTTVGMEI